MVENTAFLILSCVLGTGDHNQVCLIINHNCGLGMDAVHLRIAFKPGRAENRVIRFAVILQLLRSGADQQLMDKQILRRQFVDHPKFLSFHRVCTGHAIKDKDLTPLQIGRQLARICVKLFREIGRLTFPHAMLS